MIDFSQPYSKPDFINFLERFLPEDFKKSAEEINIPFQTKYFEKVTLLGETENINMAVYEVQHLSENDARVGLTREMFRLMAAFGKRRSLVILVPKKGNAYRFSLVTIDLKFENDRVKRTYSNPKRYSFILGEHAKIHTPQKFLITQGSVSDFEDLQKRFSVEVVNKEFYNQIAVMFSRLVGGKRKQGSRTREYNPVLELPSTPYENNEQKHKEFAVRLIGRTVFCWFLKKKKSANNIPLIPDDVLSTFAISFNPSYYHGRVEPLFFNVLNTPVNERQNEFKETPYNKIPFLNGGLFEPQADDFYTGNRPNYALKIPDDWWKEFIGILETYNFTIDENTSIDIDLSVDPEMLGRIFENLLAEINPETGESARKSTGSYYTPRPIVEYMVDESLKQYIVTKTGITEENLETLLDYSREESGLLPEQEKKIVAALNEIKVLDPACGSGAFPMGILQKMLLILQKVDHNAQNSIAQILNDIKDPVYRKLIESKLKAAQVYDDEDLDDYARKLNIIRRSIYGVDIQPVAIDIAKLRFFLSIIVDEVIQDNLPNRGIEPLPNLEFKFVCANTLIPLPPNRELFENIDAIETLEKLRDEYFISFGEDKRTIKKEFTRVQAKMFNASINLLNREPGTHNAAPQTQTQMLATWNPFNNETTSWFDAKWMFGEKDGFDIVIGNPPYINANELKKKLGKVNYENLKSHFKSSRGTIDIYILFYEKGLNLLNTGGNIIFITPNRFLSASYGSALRKILFQNSTFISILDCSSVKVFKDASIYPIVCCFRKGENLEQSYIRTGISDEDYQFSYNRTEYQLLNLLPDLIWGFLINNHLEITLKVKNQSVSLDECGYINATSTAKEADEFHPHINLNEGIRIVNTGTIDKYKILWGVKDFQDKGTKFLSPLLNIDSKTISQNRKDLYTKPKIIFAKIAITPEAFLDDKGDYASINTNCIHSFNSKFLPKYILAWVNSKLFQYCFECYFDSLKMAGGYLLYSAPNLSHMFIKEAENMEQLIISKIIETELSKQQAKNESIIIIDILFYKLYELTYDEALIVDPELGKIISREDYEKAGIEELAEWGVS
ncbi:MAG: Eco57I restriction-modification methylase domain-containing protein [Draconibacterium sp.]|nr:Eco57I restriction-modification methylase domain-containing protein [Draconibacterium sp.]